MKYFLLFILFLSNSLYAFESKGVYRLNPFPTTDWISKTEITHERAEADLSQALSGKTKIIENSTKASQMIAKKFSDSTFLGVEFSATSATMTQLRNAEFSTQKSTQSGVTEPTFFLYSRRSWPRIEGDSVIDFFFSLTPSLLERKVGGDDGNYYTGQNIYQFELNRGTFYHNWDFNLKFHYTLYGEKKEVDTDTNSKRESEPTGEFYTMFEFQHTLDEIYFLRGGIGLRLIEDLNSSYQSKNTVLQQGTGSDMYLGLVRKGKKYTWILRLERRKNDYFIKQESLNVEGKYIVKTISLALLNEF